jgi:serine protease
MNTLVKFAVPASLAVLLSACGQSGTSTLPGGVQSQSQAHQSAVVQSQAQFGKIADNRVFMPLAGHQSQVKHDLSGALDYGNGYVQHNPVIYVIYWGLTAKNCATEKGRTQSCDPNNIRPTQESFLENVGGSNWQSTVTQYYDDINGNINDPTGQFVAQGLKGKKKIVECGVGSNCILDKSLPPISPTDHDIQIESEKLVNAFGSNENASYVVQTPYGHNEGGFGTSWCAYHGSFVYKGSNVAYTYMPYIPEAGGSCGANFVNKGQAGTLDGVTIVEGHELEETQTDPVPPSGWYGSGGEIGDLCAWNPATSNQPFGNNTTFPVQPLWSDVANACTLTGPNGP